MCLPLKKIEKIGGNTGKWFGEDDRFGNMTCEESCGNGVWLAKRKSCEHTWVCSGIENIYEKQI